VTPTEKPRAPGTALLLAAAEELTEKGHASVSLRAVARRAGVSHAAPAHFFGDRAGMLTAVAVDGFHRLAVALRDAGGVETDGEERFAAQGLAYLDFGLAHPALMDLMFRQAELVPDDPELIVAQREALGPLREGLDGVVGEQAEEWSLVSWAMVHGLVSLVRERALARVAETEPEAAAELARRLVRLYAAGVTAAARRAP
jgi:AcrR family transcriptional regulator